MVNDTNLQFIREKIIQLRSAVMYDASNGLVKLGNDVVTAIRVDDEGHLWFVTNNPSHRIEECEQCFPARLCFYRKGIQFTMEISGRATIVNDSYSYDLTVSDPRPKNSNKVLVKLAMINIEYTEPHAKRPKSKVEMVLENWYTWFLRTVSVHHNTGSVLKKLRQTQ
ncbi:MAG: hypothetical protein ACHQFX_13695 [Chitinophagales bacterium]